MKELIISVRNLLFNELINRRYTTMNGPSNLLQEILAGLQGEVDMFVCLYVCICICIK